MSATQNIIATGRHGSQAYWVAQRSAISAIASSFTAVRMDADGGYVSSKAGEARLWRIVGAPVAKSPVRALIPIRRCVLWGWIQEGKAPKPVKLGARTANNSLESRLGFSPIGSLGKW